MSLQVVILAAGQGKRMYSNNPKVLHTLAGKTLLDHVLEKAVALSPESKPIIVNGHLGHLLQEKLTNTNISWVKQDKQCGTGHALLQALPLINEQNHVLVLCGDVPLTTEKTLRALVDNTPENAVGILTAFLKQPFGYGRIKRDNQHQVMGIVEEKDATIDEKQINEINSGIYLLPAAHLKKWLSSLKNNNAQHEYYLTDVIPLAVQQGVMIHAVHPDQVEEIYGVNDKVQLAHLERFYQRQRSLEMMRQGVTFLTQHAWIFVVKCNLVEMSASM